jgi:hypothetical protein
VIGCSSKNDSITATNTENNSIRLTSGCSISKVLKENNNVHVVYLESGLYDITAELLFGTYNIVGVGDNVNLIADNDQGGGLSIQGANLTMSGIKDFFSTGGSSPLITIASGYLEIHFIKMQSNYDAVVWILGGVTKLYGDTLISSDDNAIIGHGGAYGTMYMYIKNIVAKGICRGTITNGGDLGEPSNLFYLGRKLKL